MNAIIMLVVVLLPIMAGLLVPVLPFQNRKQMMWYVEGVTVITSVLVLVMLMNRPESALNLFRFSENMLLKFQLDGLGMVFAGMVAFLWPLAILYSFEYMKHEGHEKSFFMFYTITYGITLGVALSGDIVTMYVFFEMLSLVTVPLVMHTLTREAIHASRTYFFYMIGGAACAFMGMIFVLNYGSSSFVMGGGLNLEKIGSKENLLLFGYLMCFCGFGVKTAMWPCSGWLPKAGVAPTPVTALLHAVAVVKTGAFAAMRVTYYSFGTEFLKGTWAQSFLLVLIIFTIVYGCSRGVKETHLKRRLAWSTVSNLSYILFGVALMTPLGLVGALSHMIFHATMKICLFFCAGAVIYKTGKNYVYELDGFGRKMPVVFICFTISGLALMGLPGLCGFISKWNLAAAAVESGTVLAYVGVAALLVSALLTALYIMPVSVRAFFPGKDFDYHTITWVKDPNWMMTVPLVILVLLIGYFGVHPQPVLDVFAAVAAGM